MTINESFSILLLLFILLIDILYPFRLSSRVFWLAVANFLLCPFIFIWVVLYSFFSYAEVRKLNTIVSQSVYCPIANSVV